MVNQFNGTNRDFYFLKRFMRKKNSLNNHLFYTLRECLHRDEANRSKVKKKSICKVKMLIWRHSRKVERNLIHMFYSMTKI